MVVDHDAATRRLLTCALAQEGFACQEAHDGGQAAELLGRHAYDVVLADLRTPNRNGSSFVVDLLALPQRPLTVVLTDLAEPRLFHRLLTGGVDDVVLKPLDHAYVAAKVKGLLGRRQARRAAGPAEKAVARGAVLGDDERDSPIDASSFQARLKTASDILPASECAIDVYNLARSRKADGQRVAALIQRDPSLSFDVLRLANSSFYNPTRTKIVDLAHAVARIGMKRIGELALASHSLRMLSAQKIPWFDADLMWRRSIAAGVAAEFLLEEGGHQNMDEGILLSAIMHSLGRVVLATLYPTRYKAMIDRCHRLGIGLSHQEDVEFPENPARVLSRLMSDWSIPLEIGAPLRFLADGYVSLSRLPDSLRTKVELLKVAVLAGRLAVGSWEPWDQVDFPAETVLQRLRIRSLGRIIEQTRQDAEQIANYGRSGESPSSRPRGAEAACEPVPYRDLSGGSFDRLRGRHSARHGPETSRRWRSGGRRRASDDRQLSQLAPRPAAGSSRPLPGWPDGGDRRRLERALRARGRGGHAAQQLRRATANSAGCDRSPPATRGRPGRCRGLLTRPNPVRNGDSGSSGKPPDPGCQNG